MKKNDQVAVTESLINVKGNRRGSMRINRRGSFIKYYKTLRLFKRNRRNIKNDWFVCKSNESSAVMKERDYDDGKSESPTNTANDTTLPLSEFVSSENLYVVDPSLRPHQPTPGWDWRNPKAPEKWKNVIIEQGRGAKPYLGRNDLDMLFNYLLVESPCNRLRLLWNKAAAANQTEEFLCAFAKVLSGKNIRDNGETNVKKDSNRRSYEQVKRLRIVRTHENGNKYVTSLENGFITTVFDVEI